MKKVDNLELDCVVGGDSISGTVINAFANVIKLLMDAGKSVGSAIRRVAEGNLCPLDWKILPILAFFWKKSEKNVEI